jgi:hypothetical protein
LSFNAKIILDKKLNQGLIWKSRFACHAIRKMLI